MEIRKVLRFNTAMGFTIPKKYYRVLNIGWKDLVELYLVDHETLILKKHMVSEQKSVDRSTSNRPAVIA